MSLMLQEFLARARDSPAREGASFILEMET